LPNSLSFSAKQLSYSRSLQKLFKKLQIKQTGHEFQKTLFVTQQLRGPASAWWANFTATIQDGHQMPWAKFRIAFCGHQILAALMAHKLQEFLHL
jgi:hypothetical protein